ncbi:MAG: hypothetical protein J1E39_08155 [Eubacterium sp.]|nr:hypothetical protein [Eubacterium sp.]
MLKKIMLIAAAAAVFCCGCSADYSNIDGYDRIMNARELYAGLYGAHLTVTDEGRGLVTQELTFLYDDVDRLAYSYYGTDGETEYREYHDGYEYSYTDENGEWATIKEGEQNYRGYNRVSKLSMADVGMIFIKPESIESSTVEQKGSDTIITTVYRSEELSEMMSAQLGTDGTLTEFSVIYTLNSTGYCTSMEQKGVAELNGETQKIDYLLTIDSMNDIAKINPPSELQ